MVDQLKFPVTREEELRYYTTPRYDTWNSTTTFVGSNDDVLKPSLLRRSRSSVLSKWQKARSSCVSLPTDCRLWWYKSIQHLASLCRNWWLVELISWCIGALCMVFIATLLAAWNGRPLPDRFPLGLKLNAYISVFAAIAKLALAVCLEESLATQKYLWYTTKTPQRPLLDFERFELAARRPIGALKLIWRVKAKSFATLGAIIFLLSLGLDPIFQQLVSYPSRPSSENPSTVSRLVIFDQSNQVMTADGPIIQGDVALRAVVPKYFRGNESNFIMNTFCPSETCTWPDFETLAICSTCEDVTSHLTHGCMQESGSWRTDFNPEPPRTNSTTSTSCGWFFNATTNDPLLMTGYNLDDHGILYARFLNYHDPVQNDLYWGGSMLSKGVPTPLSDFAMVSSPDLDAIYRNETPQAISCTFRWCVQKVSATFAEGMYQETVKSIFTNDTAVPEPLSCTVKPDGTRDWKYDANITLSPPDSNDTFFVRDDTMLSARFSLDIYIPNMIVQPNATAATVVHYPLPTENQGPASETRFNEAWLVPGRGEEIIHNLAADLSKSIRNDPRFAETVYGSGVFVTYVQVEWGFFIFPLLILCSTMGLLIATIVQTYKRDVWKASDLTTLVHGLSENAMRQLKDAQSMREVRELAKDLPVYLTRHDEGRRQLDVGFVGKGAGSCVVTLPRK